MFLSHTSELAEFPRGGSYIERAKEAVIRAEHLPLCMQFFPATDASPSDYDVAAVCRCDVYVGIYGTRYGTPVRERPEISYTEQEFNAATEAGMPRLIFLTDPDSEELRLPGKAMQDPEYGARQLAFRQRVSCSGCFIVNFFRNPDHLAWLLEHALTKLAHGSAPSRGALATPNPIPAAKRPVPKYLPHLPDRQVQDDVLAKALRRWMRSLDPLPLVVMLHGEGEQAPSTYIERFLAHTAPLLLRATIPASPAPTYCELPEPASFAAMAADGWREHFDNRLLINSAVNRTLDDFMASRPEPIILQSSLDPTCWADGGVALLEQVCRFWKDWASRGAQPSGRKRLIHFIVMTYHKPKRPAIRPHSLRWLFQRYWHYKWRIRRFDRLRRRLDAGIGEIIRTIAPDAVALPPFRDVSHDDVLHWLNSEPVRKFLGDADPRELRQQIERLHPLDSQQLVPAPRPMQALADDLYSLLTRYPASR
ncbi:MAG: DUF4062 domain-containing protein [Cyanobium sp.]